MNIRSFYSFLEVAKTLSYSKTGKSKFLDRTTIRKQIQSLEKEFNCTLFHRNGNQLTLTEEGQRFIAVARDITASFEQGKRSFLEEQKQTPPISLVVTPYIANFILADFLKHCMDKKKEQKIQLNIASSDILETVLESELTHIVLTETLIPKLAEEAFSFSEGRFALAVPKNSWKTTEKKPEIFEKYFLENYKVLLGGFPSIIHPLKEKIKHLSSNAIFENSPHTMLSLQLVQSGLGIAYVPMHTFKNNLFKKLEYIETPVSKTINANIFLTILSENQATMEFYALFLDFMHERVGPDCFSKRHASF